MADTHADRLVVVHHDDTRSVYTEVTYCPWPDGVTVYRDGVLTVWTEPLVAV